MPLFCLEVFLDRMRVIVPLFFLVFIPQEGVYDGLDKQCFWGVDLSSTVGG